MWHRAGHGIARKAGCILAIFLFLLCADGLAEDMIFEEADAMRPVLAIIELNATSKYQDGNMAWILSGPPRMDSQGKTQESGLAIVEGRITVYKVARLLRQKIIVTLSGQTDDPDLLISVNPPILEFEAYTKIQTKDFKVAIRLSTPMLPYSTAQEFPKKVEVFGTWSTQIQTGTPNEGGQIDPYPIYVRVKPFYYMQLLTDPPFIKMLPGQTKTVDIVIKNQGNAFDRYDVMIPHEGMLAKRGWVFEMNRTSVMVPPMSDGLIRLTITSPRKFQSPYHMGVSSFMIHAESFNTLELVEQGDIMTPLHYDTDVLISVIGPDIIYVPVVWALLLYLVLTIILFNLGFNIFTFRRRRFLLPEGKDPGFLWVANKIFNRRKDNQVRRAEKGKGGPFRMRERSKASPETKRLRPSSSAPLSVLRPRPLQGPSQGSDLDISRLDIDRIGSNDSVGQRKPLSITRPATPKGGTKPLNEILEDL